MLRNGSAQEVAIAHFATSCGCTEISPASLAIPAGKSGTLRLTIDLTPSAGERGPIGGSREFGLAIRAMSKNGDDPPVPWVVKGKVKRLLGLSETFADFGKHADLAPQIPGRRVAVEAAVPCRLEIDEKPVWLQAEPVGSDGMNWTIEMRPRAGLAVGIYTGRVRLTAHLPEGESVKAVVIPVRTEVLQDLQATPHRIAVGLRKQGESCVEAVAIRSLTGRAIKAVRYRVEGVHAEATRDPSRPWTFAVAVGVARIGRCDGAVVFTVETDDGKTAEVTVPVGYHGAAPDQAVEK